MRDPATHFDMVRCGIALYGCDPMNEDPDRHGLEPALELSSYVAAVKLARPGESAGYGRRFVAEHDTWVATVPIGYGDGIRRALTGRLDVLIAGRRLPTVGTISMDNLTVGLGPDRPLDIGPEATVTLVGRNGPQRQTIENLASSIDTIAHEILCGLSARVSREYHRDGEPVRSATAASLAAIAPDVWLVGGPVRDELLGRETADYDVVLAATDEGTVAEVARALARAENGFAFSLSGGIRRLARGGDRGGAWQIDVTPLGAPDSIEADLALRDLTVNAMARALGEEDRF